MRARRLVSLLLLLQLGRRWTAAELAAQLGTSVRTVHRDIEALGEAGVPVHAERGPGGGFTLPPSYRSRLPLSADEAQALLIGAPGAAGALGLGALLLDARRKLLASLPAELRQAASQAQALFHVDEPRWFSRADESPFLAELASAASEQRRVAIEYRRGDQVDARTLDPLGLVLKAGVWYLVGRSEGETRIYRVSRLLTVTVTDEAFERPAQFDLIAFWERSRDEFETSRPRVDVLVRVERRDVRALRQAVDWSVRPAVDAGGVDSDGGRVEFLLPFERLEFAYADLVKLGGAVEVREPSELRERFAQTGRELVARYAISEDAPDAPASVSAHGSAGGTSPDRPVSRETESARGLPRRTLAN
jgi:predicted DNA-binding transcriptional regulator YafY